MQQLTGFTFFAGFSVLWLTFIQFLPVKHLIGKNRIEVAMYKRANIHYQLPLFFQKGTFIQPGEFFGVKYFQATVFIINGCKIKPLFPLCLLKAIGNKFFAVKPDSGYGKGRILPTIGQYINQLLQHIINRFPGFNQGTCFIDTGKLFQTLFVLICKIV